MAQRQQSIFKLVLSAMFLALALVLPFLTGQIQQIGNALCPMHFPILLCGFFCGPWYAMGIGFIAPIFRFFLFGMPPIVPQGISMAFELAAYGLVSGLLHRLFPNKKIFFYLTLIIAMLVGRGVWGIMRLILLGLANYQFGWELFLSGAFTTAIPGIILQILLIPVLVMAVNASFPKANALQTNYLKKNREAVYCDADNDFANKNALS